MKCHCCSVVKVSVLIVYNYHVKRCRPTLNEVNLHLHKLDNLLDLNELNNSPLKGLLRRKI